MEQETQKQLQHDISNHLNIKEAYVKNVIQLTNEDNTIPFIARYRKEQTGGLDEVQLREILEHWEYGVQLHKRKNEVLRLIEEQGRLTEELEANITSATKLQAVEDLYRPYKQKRRTRATKAKEKGLEPLAEWLLSLPEKDVHNEARLFIDEEKGVESAEDALQGARDIIAETISDDATIRQWTRDKTYNKGLMASRLKNKENDERETYAMYYEYDEPVKNIVPHRILAVNRGEKEDALKVSINAPTEEILSYITRKMTNNKTFASAQEIESAIEDGYKRLIAPSVERDIRQSLTERAEEQAIHIFAENLKHLLLQPPMKEKNVLGVDPAFRTGCKLSVVDPTGKVLDIAVIYPTPPRNEVEKAKKHVLSLISKYDIDMIAIGNGTASRETEQFIAEVIQESQKQDVYYLIVNEAGASVYSASKLAREEFPDLQVEERSAVSIARRLQDPLAELVKIDPKSVGVGQYQHDVAQKELNDSLKFVVETVVNRVGVNINTASASLLQYVSGLNKTVANNIVKFREENGRYTNRTAIKKVPRLGNKTFVQCAGFLRVPNGSEPLDQTPIHPESYQEAKQLLQSLGDDTNALGTEELTKQLKDLNLRERANELDIGRPTLEDIVEALMKPGRDPRDDVRTPLLKQDILKLEDLEEGMHLEGTVRNVVDFGAFVDIGLKNDGLVHISKMANRFVKHPLDVVQVGEIINVWVDGVDPQKGRVALTMLTP